MDARLPVATGRRTGGSHRHGHAGHAAGSGGAGGGVFSNMTPTSRLHANSSAGVRDVQQSIHDMLGAGPAANTSGRAAGGGAGMLGHHTGSSGSLGRGGGRSDSPSGGEDLPMMGGARPGEHGGVRHYLGYGDDDDMPEATRTRTRARDVREQAEIDLLRYGDYKPPNAAFRSPGEPDILGTSADTVDSTPAMGAGMGMGNMTARRREQASVRIQPIDNADARLAAAKAAGGRHEVPDLHLQRRQHIHDALYADPPKSVRPGYDDAGSEIGDGHQAPGAALRSGVARRWGGGLSLDTTTSPSQSNSSSASPAHAQSESRLPPTKPVHDLDPLLRRSTDSGAPRTHRGLAGGSHGVGIDDLQSWGEDSDGPGAHTGDVDHDGFVNAGAADAHRRVVSPLAYDGRTGASASDDRGAANYPLVAGGGEGGRRLPASKPRVSYGPLSGLSHAGKSGGPDGRTGDVTGVIGAERDSGRGRANRMDVAGDLRPLGRDVRNMHVTDGPGGGSDRPKSSKRRVQRRLGPLAPGVGGADAGGLNSMMPLRSPGNRQRYR